MAASVSPYAVGGPVGGSAVFVGRTDALAALTALLRSGPGDVAMVTGPPGMGRSSLLTELAQHLEEHAEVHAVQVHLADRAWDPLDDAVNHLARAAAAGANRPNTDASTIGSARG